MSISSKPTRLKDPSGHTSYACDDDEGFFFLYQPHGDGVLNTFGCREELAFDWDDEHPRNRWLGFMWNENIMVGRLDRLWSDYETKMGIKAADQTVFHRVLGDDEDDRTPRLNRHLVLLHLSPFWTKTQTHRSVCSMLLRLLVVYYKDSWNQGIKAYQLAAGCREALEWFLAGNTKPTYKAWNEDYEKACDEYDKVYAKWEDACTKIEDKGGKGSDYPDEPEYPTNREDEYGSGFYAEFADRSTADIKRLLVKP